MTNDEFAEDLIPGRLKRSHSYHSRYGKMTYGEIKALANGHPTDGKAQQMKKLIEQAARLSEKMRNRGL